MNNTRLAEIYDVHTVQISRWRSEGIAAGIPCPLDHPEQMPDWWMAMVAAGHKQKGVPVKMQAAADKVSAVIRRQDRDDDGGGMDDEESPALDTDGEFSYALTVEMAATNLKALKVLLLHAIKTKNTADLAKLQRSLKEAQDAYRALHKDRGKIESEAGESLPRSKVREAMLEIHGNIPKRLRRSMKNLYDDLPELLADRIKWEQRVDTVVDEACTALQNSGFAAIEE